MKHLGKCEGKKSLERACHRWKNNVKTDLTQTWPENGASFHVAQIRSSDGFT
jgi:hypothetical protein